MSYSHLGEMMDEQDKRDAYEQLRKRAAEMGFSCVNEALDELEEMKK